MDLAQKFLPHYLFHSQEKYFPIDMNEYLLKNKTVKRDTLHYSFRTDPKKKNKFWIYYWMFYSFDSGSLWFGMDSHPLDLEVVIIQVHLFKIEKICFCPHTTPEHFWLSPNDSLLLLDEHETFTIFPSLGKHAPYPFGGTIWRYYGLGNDYNDKRIFKTFTLEIIQQETLHHPFFSSHQHLLSMDLESIPTVPLHSVPLRMIFIPLIFINVYFFIKKMCLHRNGNLRATKIHSIF